MVVRNLVESADNVVKLARTASAHRIALPRTEAWMVMAAVTEAEVAAVERRIQEQAEAANAAKAQLAMAQLVRIHYTHIIHTRIYGSCRLA